MAGTRNERPPNGESPMTEADWTRFAEEHRLSEREVEIVREIIRDQGASEIARNLGISIDTVKTYKKRLYGKLNVESQIGIAMVVFRWHAQCGGDGRDAD